MSYDEEPIFFSVSMTLRNKSFFLRVDKTFGKDEEPFFPSEKWSNFMLLLLPVLLLPGTRSKLLNSNQ